MIHITAPADVKNLSLLLIRIVVGISFLVSARNKHRDIRKFAKNNGLPVAAAVVVMCLEFVSAAALILGILAQYAAAAIVLLMLGTIRLHIFKWKSPYWASQGGWEYDLMLLSFALAILAFGAGSWVLIR